LPAFSAGLYAALLAHLAGLLQGQARSMAALSFREAWLLLANRPPLSAPPAFPDPSGLLPAA